MPKRITTKKAIFLCFMGGLTIVASRGCGWQHQRYLQSIRKQEKLLLQQKNFDPLEIDVAKPLPWSLGKPKEWENVLVSLRGRFTGEKYWIGLILGCLSIDGRNQGWDFRLLRHL